ncbi:1976_t:CDS:2, partial [Acaulospora colombiana]
MENASLISGVSMWAQKVFELLESGIRFEGVGGTEEMRLKKASAGLVLKVEEVGHNWRLRSSGLGLATTVELQRSGGFIAVLDIQDIPEEAKRTLGSQARYFKADLTKDAEIERAVNQSLEWSKQTGAVLGGVVNCGGVAVAQK